MHEPEHKIKAGKYRVFCCKEHLKEALKNFVEYIKKLDETLYWEFRRSWYI